MAINKHRRRLVVFLILAVVVIATFSYVLFSKKANYNDLSGRYDFNKLAFQDGDLIFRRGLSLSSHAVLLSDKNSRFSHVGMIRILNGKAFVVHAVPGESEQEVEYLKMEPVSEFLDKEKATLGAIYRLKNADKEKNLIVAKKVEGFARKKLTFDNKYDLESDNKLYCTELIWKAYKSIGIDLTEGKRNKLNFPIGPSEIILPSLIQHSSLLEEIYLFN